MASRSIVFITGANTGIGFEAVKALLRSEKPYHVLLGSRTPSKGEDAIAQLKKEFPGSEDKVELVQIDITDDASIESALETVKSKFGKVDVLVNNAGASFDAQFNKDLEIPRELFNKTYDLNVSGTHALTAKFAPLLIKSSSPRLIFLTSGLSTLEGSSKSFLLNFGAPVSPGWPKEGLFLGVAYRASKAALNMVALGWHSVLKTDGVKVFTISPGFLATNLGGNPEMLKKAGAGDPSIGGDLLRKVIEGERDADVGKVVTQDGKVQAW